VNGSFYAKRPFAGPEAVLAYLSRYTTHRVAISNSRLSAADERGVTFRWKDYREHGRHPHKSMTLPTEEFMRRFLLHVLPSGFHRIRHYGLLANANRKHAIGTARELLISPRQPLPLSPAMAAPITAAPGLPSCAGSAARRCSSSRPCACSAHPRTAGLNWPHLIDIASINRTFTAFCKIMPPRTPVAAGCKTIHCRHYNRLLTHVAAASLSWPPAHIDHRSPDDLRLTRF